MASIGTGSVSKPRFAPKPPTTMTIHYLDPSVPIEEETLPSYNSNEWYPVEIGEVFNCRYQVLGKLGWSSSSTDWLVQDLDSHDYQVLKVYNVHNRSPNQSLTDVDDAISREIHAYTIMDKINSPTMVGAETMHKGSRNVRPARDYFFIHNAGNLHHCLVLQPMWDNVLRLEQNHPSLMLHDLQLRASIAYLLKGLDYLHTHCSITHNNIKLTSIMFTIANINVLMDFEAAEDRDPSPRKKLNDRTIYQSRQFRSQEFGVPKLCDFGEARFGAIKRDDFIQPDSYSPPELLLQTSWDHKVDIWMVGILAWRLFEGTHLFNGRDPNTMQWDPRYHIAEIIAILGDPPPEFITQGKIYGIIFDDQGCWTNSVPIPKDVDAFGGNPLCRVNKRGFLEFLFSMLKWDPNMRKSARELLQDPWLKSDQFPWL